MISSRLHFVSIFIDDRCICIVQHCLEFIKVNIPYTKVFTKLSRFHSTSAIVAAVGIITPVEPTCILFGISDTHTQKVVFKALYENDFGNEANA